MENPGEASGEDWAADPDYLVRPYVSHSVDQPSEPLDDPEAAASASSGGAAASGWYGPVAPQEPPTAPLPAAVAVGSGRHGGTAGRRRALTAAPRKWYLTAYRLYIAVGAAVVIVAFVGGVLLLALPGHSAPVTASKCPPGGCHRVAGQTPGSVLPVTAPSATASAHPAAFTSPTAPSSATRAATTGATTTRTAAAPTTAAPSASATTARSVAPTGSSSSPAPSPTTTAPGLTPGSTISIRATTACCTSFYIRHDDNDNRVVITQITRGSPPNDKADATWIVRAGLANSSCVSFESANEPGMYLRHFHFELYLDQDDGSSQFADDATFCPQPGNSGQGYSFQSVNHPDEYIRHYDYVVYIASDGGRNPWDDSNLWPDDTTWLVSQPWG
jgi:Alpha-L-arabinofuranosidase B (ABFB) domain